MSAYIPEDRRQALARGEDLPDRANGAALFADISGFTALTESLTRTLGPLRGAEELSRQLASIYGALIGEVGRYGGSVIGFSGDAITCWFGDDDGLRAVTAGLAMQDRMRAFASVPLPEGGAASLAVKVALVSGPARRFVVGDPQVQRVDVLAGGTLERLAAAEQLAGRGEVVVDGSVAGLEGRVRVSGWRGEGSRRVALIGGLAEPVPPAPWPSLPAEALSDEQLQPWLLPAVYERLRHGLGQFLADFRPAAALFLSFRGIDYDEDEAAGDKLDRFVRWVQAVVARCDGLLIQLTLGDKGSYLYVVFGAPVAHDDDASRAVAAALELRKPPAELAFVRSLRIGIAYGQMYAGAYGSSTRSTYGVLGPKTNLAARLMKEAEPGGILCDEELYRQARRSWTFDALAPVQVKGRREQVKVYAPTGQVATSGSPGTVGALIGREEPMARLTTALDDVIAAAGQVSFLEGEAGIGKSRLVRELSRLAQSKGVAVFAGAGQSIERHTPYRAWRDILTAFLALGELADPSSRQERARSVVQEVAPELAERLPLLNDVLNLGLAETGLTAALEPAPRQERLLGLVTELLQRAARVRPLVVVLEDAHWLDSLSWELAERLARALRGERLWLLVVSRPLDEHHGGARAAALRALPGSGRLVLDSLGPEALVALVAERLGLAVEAVPEAVASLVHERAGGNPFFAEELVQTLRDQELIRVRSDGESARCEVNAELQKRHLLPDTLQGLMLSRFDRLPPDRQLTLKVASVIGRIFASTPLRETLSRLTARPRQLRPAQLLELKERGFILPEALEPELSYIFRHILTHEVIYQTLLYAQRRQVHRAVAEWYEEAYAESLADVYSLLAHHYGRAAEGTTDDALLAKAADYLSRSGRQLTYLCAYPEAITTFERGLGLLPETSAWHATRASLLVHLGNIYERTGDYPAATAYLQDGLALARQAHEAGLVVQALSQLSLASTRQGDYGAAQLLAGEALSLAEGAGDRVGSAHARMRLGLLAAYQGDFDGAIAHLEAGLALYEALGDGNSLASCLNNLGAVAFFRNDYPAAAHYFGRALVIARERGDRDGIGKYLANLGSVAQKQGDYDAASRYYEESSLIFQAIGSREDVVTNVLSLGDIAAAQDRDLEARQHYLSALAEARALGALPVVLLTLCGIAMGYVKETHLDRAAELLGLVLGHPAKNPEVEEQARPVLTSLELALDAARLQAALDRGRTLALDEIVRELTSAGAQA